MRHRIVRWAAWTLGASTLAVVAAIALTASSAMASGFQLQSTFGETGTGPGQFEEPGAVAVESATGDVFVVDVKNERVEKFAPQADGEYNEIGEIIPPSIGGELESDSGVAVDNSGGAFGGYVYLAHGAYVLQFKPKTASPNEYEFTGIRMKMPELFEICMGNICEERDIGSGGSTSESIMRNVVVTAGGLVRITDAGYYTAVFEPETGDEVGTPQQASEHAVIDIADTSGGIVYVTAGEPHSFVPALIRFKESDVSVLEEDTLIAALGKEGIAGPVAAAPNGNAYVLSKEGETHVDVFAANALTGSTPIEEFGAGQIGASHGMAYSTRKGGTLYVSDAAADRVDVYGLPGSPPEVNCGSTTPAAEALTVNCMVKPEAAEASWKLEYRRPNGSWTMAQEGIVTSEEVVAAYIAGLEPNSTYDWRFVVSNATGSSEGTGEATTSAVPSTATIGSAAGVLARSATLVGAVDPENSLTTYRFEYGACASSTSCAGSPYTNSMPGAGEAEAGSGFDEMTVSQRASELLPGTTYHYRLVALNLAGETVSDEATFTTAPLSQPEVLTGEASGITGSTATLSGSIDPHGQAVAYVWEVGTTTDYGTSIFGSAGESEAAVTITLPLSGLLSGTTYHYRLVAVSPLGTVYGADHSFATQAFGVIDDPTAVMLLSSVPIFPTVDLGGKGQSKGKSGKKSCQAKFKHVKNAKQRRRKIAMCRKQSEKRKG